MQVSLLGLSPGLAGISLPVSSQLRESALWGAWPRAPKVGAAGLFLTSDSPVEQ